MHHFTWQLGYIQANTLQPALNCCCCTLTFKHCLCLLLLVKMCNKYLITTYIMLTSLHGLPVYFTVMERNAHVFQGSRGGNCFFFCFFNVFIHIYCISGGTQGIKKNSNRGRNQLAWFPSPWLVLLILK